PRFIPVLEPVNKNIGENIIINYVCNQSSNLTIYYNGVSIASVNASMSVQANPVVASPGNQQIIGLAVNGTQTRSDTINFFVAPSTNTVPLPNGARDGINYLAGDTSVVLVLFAPAKNRVSVIGDFNNWTQQAAYQMNKT